MDLPFPPKEISLGKTDATLKGGGVPQSDGHLHSVIRQAALPAAYSVGVNGIV